MLTNYSRSRLLYVSQLMHCAIGKQLGLVQCSLREKLLSFGVLVLSQHVHANVVCTLFQQSIVLSPLLAINIIAICI
jgi:hypothetical protein